ncbi:glycoside hydrolase family 88 protein [Butyrivibrio sp. INlla21]|uniref:glycoside hydrolase family 88 protein n=1 Tax=Butyrivibrio sp. INlla21 TaxID=1520811 RepID=UPI0008F226AF|nr:glycoside hydrolase family 88 protein [Butyrivibrio sp. INlla21]SFU70879.1 unsaturated chondroitin disaccharide hydrolase [Butyrivibrio sp. INlla21]
MRKLTDSEKQWVDATLKKVADKMEVVTKRSLDKIPYTTDKYGRFDDKSGKDICWWTNGFWGGEMWQLYKLTGNEMYKKEAIKVEDKLDENLMNIEGLDHDNGFKWLPTSVCRYKLFNNKESYNRAMLAATNMAGRFNIVGRFIRAWNNWDDVDRRGFAIIDCMMNLPLLYWASEETTDPRFEMIARAHADTAMKAFVREDGSVNHIIIFDPETGEIVGKPGGQGYGEGSSWTRGQSWGIYGFTLSYKYTGDEKYLDTAKAIANYVLSQIPDSYLIPIDYRQPDDIKLEDSTAAAITASGLIELSQATGDDELSDRYLDAAFKLLKTLDEKRISWGTDTDNLLNNCAVDYHGDGHDMSIIYGDYYFIEAIMKLAGNALEIF